MKKPITYSILLAFSLLALIACKEEKKELIIIGTVHFPTENINVDSIYQALEKTQPEVILMERDSVGFDESFNRIQTYDENEDKAITRYLENHPKTLLRPFEFEGRNQYRKDIGLYPQANAVYQKLNELKRSGSFNEKESIFWDQFVERWIKSDSIDKGDLKTLNNPSSDEILAQMKAFQYTQTKIIVNSNEAFEAQMKDAKGEMVSLRDYFNKWEQFEHYDRNNAMVDNIIKTMQSMPNKKFVLLVGYHHRYYLKKALEEGAYKIKIKEFYE